MLFRNLTIFALIAAAGSAYGADNLPSENDKKYVAVKVTIRRPHYQDVSYIEKVYVSEDSLNKVVLDAIKLPLDINSTSTFHKTLFVNGTSHKNDTRLLNRQFVKGIRNISYNGSLALEDYEKNACHTPFEVVIEAPRHPQIVKQVRNRELTGRKISTKTITSLEPDNTKNFPAYIPYLVQKNPADIYLTYETDRIDKMNIKASTTIKDFTEHVKAKYGKEYEVKTNIFFERCETMSEKSLAKKVVEHSDSIYKSLDSEDYVYQPFQAFTPFRVALYTKQNAALGLEKQND